MLHIPLVKWPKLDAHVDDQEDAGHCIVQGLVTVLFFDFEHHCITFKYLLEIISP